MRYEELGSDELLLLIDRLEDERSRARLREGIWISVLAHLVLFWFLAYGPRVLWHQPHVVNPTDKDRKDLTYLDLPPDLKQVKPKTPAPPSDKNRIAQSDHPVLDRKTLQQLEAMRRAGPPLPEPSRRRLRLRLNPRSRHKLSPSALSRRRSPCNPPQQAQLEAPNPRPRRPTSTTARHRATPYARRCRARRADPAPYGGDYGANAPSQHPAMELGPDILSDTMGVDFGPYMNALSRTPNAPGYPIIPESARPPLDKQGRVGIRFKIYPDGSVKQMISRVSLRRRVARSGRLGRNYRRLYPPLPKEFKGPFLELRFGFYYNLDPDKPQ